MKKRKNSIKVYLIALALVWLLVVVWALTESEPPQGRGYYGNVMTILDQSSADVFGVAGPGIYVVNKNHKPVTAVRGGLGMIIRGVFTGDSSQASVGWRGLSKGLTRTGSGIFLLAVIVASVAGFFVALFPLMRRRVAQEEEIMKDESLSIAEDQRKKIFADFMETHDSEFLSPNLGREIGAGSSTNPFFGLSSGFGQMLERNAEKADAATYAKIGRKYGLKESQLRAIVEEGKQKSWPRPSWR